MTDSSPAPGRWIPARWWARLLLALPLILMLYVRLVDVTGDLGMTNAFTMMLSSLFAILWTLWFLFASGGTWRRRFGVLGGFIAAAALFLAIFRFDRLSGAMVPIFVPRFADTSAPVELEDAADGVVVDLMTETPNDSPEFLGPGRVPEVEISLAGDWESRPPELLWRRPVGAGWAGFSVRNGFALTVELRDGQEVATCYEVESGEPCWATPLASVDFRSLVAGDGPRTTPTIDGGQVFVQSTFGTLAALDGATGAIQWSVDIEKILGLELDAESRTAVLPYGRSGSPLVTTDAAGRALVVVPGGGTADQGYVSLLALDRNTGEEIWRGGDYQISCASPAVGTVAGRRQILSVDTDRVAGYSLDSGEVLWSHPWPGRVEANANVSQPRVVGENQVFVSKGYGVGAALLEIGADGTVTEIWHKARSLRTKFTNVAIHGDHVYGLSDGILESVELATGERAWKRGRYYQGQLMRAGGHLIVVSESGEVSLVEATPERRNEVLGTIEAVSGKTWNPPALYGDILLVRNGSEATAWRLATAG